MRMSIPAALLLAAALSSCGREDPTLPALHPSDEAARIVVALDADTTALPRDPFRIESAAVEGDTLRLRVSAGGGCREHEFALLAVGGWRESYPVQVPLFLAHDAHGDPCRAIVSFDLRYDLRPLAGAYREAYQAQSDSVFLDIPDRAAVTSDAMVLYRF